MPGSPEDPQKARHNVIEAGAAYRASSSDGDLDRWINAYRALIDVLDTETADHGIAVIDLCQLIGTRWAHRRTDADWNEALDFVESWEARVPADDWRLPLYVLAHGTLLYRRADATEDDDDVARAIAILESARTQVAGGSGIDATSSTLLANLRVRRYERTQEPLDLEAALRDAGRVLSSERARPDEIRAAEKDFTKAILHRARVLESSDDLDIAIDCARHAIAQGTDPVYRADVEGVLAASLRERFEWAGDPADLEAAIQAYEAALSAPAMTPQIEASRTDDLGNAYASRHQVSRDIADLDAAITCSRRALAVSPAGCPNRTRIHANLGISLVDRARERRATDELAEAVETLRTGLRSDSVSLELEARLRVGLINALRLWDALEHNDDRLDEFIREGDAALAAALSHEADKPVSYRLTARGRSALIARRLIGALLRRSRSAPAARADISHALAVGETSKVVILTQELLRRSLPPPDGVPRATLDREEQLLAQLSTLDAHEIAPSAKLTAERALHRIHRRSQVRASLRDLWDDIANHGPAGARYAALRRDPATTLIDVLVSRPLDVSLLSLLECEDMDDGGDWVRSWCAIALPASSAEPEVLFRAPRDVLLSAEQRLRADMQQTDETEGTWWHEIAALVSVGQPGPAEVVSVSPTADGLALPWHLLVERAGWTTPAGKRLPVVQVPSLALLAASGRDQATQWHEVPDIAEYLGIADQAGVADGVRTMLRLPAIPTQSAVVVGDPATNLQSASCEVVDVAEILGVEPLTGPAATVAAVRDGLRAATLVHIAAHAVFDADNPLESFVQLADGPLPARTLVGQWNTAELVVLSACESGSGQQIVGGEVAGLATALLRSGIRVVIASLWPVDDAATAYMMKQLYRALSLGAPAPAALSAAQHVVRQQPGWSAPYYWAAFVLSQRGVEGITPET